MIVERLAQVALEHNECSVYRLLNLSFSVLREVRMCAFTKPLPCQRPGFIEVEPLRYPRQNRLCNQHARVPLISSVNTNTLLAIEDMRQCCVARAESKGRTKDSYAGARSLGVSYFQTVRRAHLRGLPLPRPLDLPIALAFGF